MLYTKDQSIFTRQFAINSILETLNTVVEPAYIDDETLSLYGFIPYELDKLPTLNLRRKEALAEVDWISAAQQFTEADKQKIEAWRWLVRNQPEIAPEVSSLPPVPQIVGKSTYLTKQNLTDQEVQLIKDYQSSDPNWILFLQVWKDYGFCSLKKAVVSLLTAYTSTKLDEIIGSV